MRGKLWPRLAHNIISLFVVRAEGTLVIIVVSLSCTSYLFGALIVFCQRQVVKNLYQIVALQQLTAALWYLVILLHCKKFLALAKVV